MQMLFGNVNVSAANSAFQMFPKVFQIVDVRFAVGVLACAMIYHLVRVALLRQPFIGVQLVSVNRRAVENIFLNDWLKRLTFAVRNNFGHHLTFALQHSKDYGFARRSATANASMTTADVSFITFNFTEQRPFVVNLRHVFADKVCHAPCRLVGHAKLPLQFLRGNSVPRSGEQINPVEPKLQRRSAVLKRSADCRVKMMPAPLASVSAFGLEPEPVRLALALRADMALPESDVEQVLQTGFVSRELREEFSDCQARFGLILFHASNIRPNPYLCQGDNSEIISMKVLLVEDDK